MSAIKRGLLIAGWAVFSFVFLIGVCLCVDAVIRVLLMVLK